MDADGNQRCICNAVNVCSMFIHWLYQTTITTPHITLRDSVNNMVRHYALRGCKGDNCDLSVYRGGGGKLQRGIERRHGGNKMEGLSGPIYIRET